MTGAWLLDHLDGAAVPAGGDVAAPHLVLVGAALALCVLIAAIDARHRIIPDSANATLAVLGLAAASPDGWKAVFATAVQGGVAFALFWGFRRLYRALRGVEGLGFGDVKFMGAATIWVGLDGVAPLVLIGCVAALGFVGLAVLRGRPVTGRTALPFGPFLALGLAILLAADQWWPPGL